MTNDPLQLAIHALNNVPNTRFRTPIGKFKTTYELVAFLEEVKRHSVAISEQFADDPENAKTWGEVFLYHVPTY